MKISGLSAKIGPILSEFKKALYHFIYPSRCLHCQEHLLEDNGLLCETCVTLLELIDPTERCLVCFGEIDKSFSKHCKYCAKNQNLFNRMGAAFDYVGPAASLVKKLKYGNQPYLADGIAAFLITQMDRLQWPIPDALIPVPIAFTHWLDRGYNQSALIAHQMSEWLNVPVWDVLKRQSGDYSQAGLTVAQRKSLEGKRFKLKNGFQLQDKSLLIIDDVMTTGSTLQRCAESLAEGHPASLYALTFCQAQRK